MKVDVTYPIAVQKLSLNNYALILPIIYQSNFTVNIAVEWSMPLPAV